ncbi:MAG: hypothetical protein KG003_11005 [Bacteroidetes bacterium]|nr:hypothetical protein [Bacteroidota bacterium]
MTPDLRKKENLHIVFWLIKDFAWIMDFHTLGVSMAIPTILLSVWLTYKSFSVKSDFFHNLAVTCWIAGNSIWMWGEFFYNDGTRAYAIPAFVAGLSVLGIYYISDFFKSKPIKKPHQ